MHCVPPTGGLLQGVPASRATCAAARLTDAGTACTLWALQLRLQALSACQCCRCLGKARPACPHCRAVWTRPPTLGSAAPQPASDPCYATLARPALPCSYSRPPASYDAASGAVKEALCSAFYGPPKGGVFSPSVQFTLYRMAQGALARCAGLPARGPPSQNGVCCDLPFVRPALQPAPLP